MPTPLHRGQRGFRPGYATIHNIHDLCTFVQDAKNLAQIERQSKIPIKNRKDSYIVFIDLKRHLTS